VSAAKRAPAANRLLAALPLNDRKRVLAKCEPVELIFGAVLCEPGERVRQVYFPTESFVSLVATVDGGAALEVGLVGNEGMIGAALSLGVKDSTLHALVQGGGPALRMSAALFRSELKQSPPFREVLNRYLCVMLAQLAQTAACTSFHVVDRRLARCLLMTQDRAHSDAFHLTHEFLAHMLGVRRVGVTKAASSMQDRNLISYSRGDISILDRGGLIAAACGCYLTDIETYSRILG
jgi:CRP-like cAMP-binding protein